MLITGTAPCAMCGVVVTINLIGTYERCEGKYCDNPNQACVIYHAKPGQYCPSCGLGPVMYTHVNEDQREDVGKEVW